MGVGGGQGLEARAWPFKAKGELMAPISRTEGLRDCREAIIRAYLANLSQRGLCKKKKKKKKNPQVYITPVLWDVPHCLRIEFCQLSQIWVQMAHRKGQKEYMCKDRNMRTPLFR